MLKTHETFDFEKGSVQIKYIYVYIYINIGLL